MGQTIILSTIVQNLQGQIPGLSSQQVLTAGAANLPALAPTPEALDILRLIWNTGISRTMILSVALVAAAVPFTLAMEWLNAKKVALARESAEEGQHAEEEDMIETVATKGARDLVSVSEETVTTDTTKSDMKKHQDPCS